MKIQLKRSNVLENGAAKEPTAEQMEFGELALNYNTADPVLFCKDSAGAIIRLTFEKQGEAPTQINVEAGDGLVADDRDEEGTIIRTISAVAAPGLGIAVSADGIALGDDWSNIPFIV